jgi:cytochrome c oxidase subunit 2
LIVGKSGTALAGGGRGLVHRRQTRVGRSLALITCLITATLPATTASETDLPQSAEPRVIEVIARRFMFEPSQIEAIKGKRLRIIVHSGDGLHGFEIKKFKVSKEIARGGKPVVIEFTPDEAGRFPIMCSLFCGKGHSDMKGALIVTAP